jgi:hypothetical protein
MAKRTGSVRTTSGSSFSIAQHAKRLAVVRIAGVASKIWLWAAKAAAECPWPEVRQLVEVDEPPVQEKEELSPIQALDQTEIVSIVRRHGENDDSYVYVDYGDSDMDVAVGLMVRGLIGLVLDDIMPVDEDEEVEDTDE